VALTIRSAVALVLIAVGAGIAAAFLWRSPSVDVGVLDARISALQAKLDSMARLLDVAQESRATSTSPATRIKDQPDDRAMDDAISSLVKRVDDLAGRLDALVDAVKSLASIQDGGQGWKPKESRLVDEVARGSRDSPETTVARFFMMTTRQVYELMGLPDHRTFTGQSAQECDWHYRTGIDGTCLVIRFETNMATRIDTLPCTMADGELTEWIKEWVKRK
jgi:hypothetical protein